MQNNISTSIYDQIINRLFKLKLNEVDAERFYIGKKPIAKEEAIRVLSKYLQHLIEVAFIGTPEDQDADNTPILSIPLSRRWDVSLMAGL